MELPEPVQNGELRMVLDPDFSRQSISPRKKMQLFTIQMHAPRKDDKVNMPATLAKAFTVLADGAQIARVENNHEMLVRVKLPAGAKKVEVQFDASWGYDSVGVYAFDVK